MKKNLTFALAVQNHKENNLQAAENLYKEVLKTNFNHFESIYNLGTIFAQTKRFDLAKQLLFKAIKIQPNYADAHNNFGNVLKELGEYEKAISSYKKVIQIQPNYANAHYNLGIVLAKLGEYEKAISSYEKAIQIQPNYLSAHYNLGILFQDLEEYQKAISSYEKAIQIQPNYASAHYNLGMVLRTLGEYQKAISSYQMAVRYKPENLVYLYHLSELDEEILNSNLKNKIHEIIERSNTTKRDIAYGNFLLSKYELIDEKYKNEFNYLLKGHQYFFESEIEKFKKEVEYSLNVLPKITDLINLNRINKNKNKESNVIKPIFIIGVPRCGSTLIEKVIASGSQYIPIGEETSIIDNVLTNLINHKQLSNSDIKKFQTKIVEKYKQKGLVQEKSNYMFTDKSLENFLYIDIIKKIFPHAKVINCRRNVLSSIMSTLKNNLVLLAWTHNLEHIFKYYDIYNKMIKNFEKTFPNFIYDLQYEKFVSDPENEAKKLMKFCGLPWDVKCLEFYKRKDLISETKSNFQIRKAVYKDSIDKYFSYKQFLSKYGNKYSWFN